MNDVAFDVSEFVGKEIEIGAFTATILPNLEVEVRAKKGFLVIYPSGYGVTSHLAQCIINGDSETLAAIIAIHYGVLSTTPDMEYLTDIVVASDKWIKRNIRKPLDDDTDKELLGELQAIKEEIDKI